MEPGTVGTAETADAGRLLPTGDGALDAPPSHDDVVASRIDASDSSTLPVAPWHIIGRVDTDDPAGARFGYPGTEIRVRFLGSGLYVTLEQRRLGHYDVWIDGVPAPAPLLVTEGERTYEVAVGLVAAEHDVALVKRTETFVGVTRLLAISATSDGTIVPSSLPNTRRIEFVGDSITCGFGVLGTDATCAFSPETEAEPLAWGAVAARELGALHTTVAISGIGVYRNYGGETTSTMPELYGRTIAEDPSSSWDHSFVPDVIVVNLGTNDFAGGKGDPGPVFEEAYESFLRQLRDIHPRSHIVAATSPMLSAANHQASRAYIDAAIAARRASGDQAVTLLDLDEQNPADGLGCGYHPNVATQAKMAAKLVDHVQSVLGW